MSGVLRICRPMSVNTVKARAGGIVTKQLTRSLSEDIRTRGLLAWLDRDGAYSQYVDTLADRHAEGEFLYPYSLSTDPLSSSCWKWQLSFDHCWCADAFLDCFHATNAKRERPDC